MIKGVVHRFPYSDEVRKNSDPKLERRSKMPARYFTMLMSIICISSTKNVAILIQAEHEF